MSSLYSFRNLQVFYIQNNDHNVNQVIFQLPVLRFNYSAEVEIALILQNERTFCTDIKLMISLPGDFKQSSI